MTIRLALAFVAVVLAALAYPWQSDLDWWILGIAIAVIVIVFAWWRGLFVTTMIARRLSVFRRNHSKREVQPSGSVTVVLRIDDPAGVGLSLPMVAGYVERFGVRCEKVRVTNLDDGSASGTWISLTLNAVGNLTALRARSAELSTGHRRDRRSSARRPSSRNVLVDDAPKLLADGDRETWRGMRGDSGYLSAYAIPIDDGLRGRLAEVWTQPTETWSAVDQRHLSTSRSTRSVRSGRPRRCAGTGGRTRASARHTAAVAQRAGASIDGPAGHPGRPATAWPFGAGRLAGRWALVSRT
ncbi:hypothetical protein MMOR_61310 [Mycolicibacterium moriokaense]|uniref:Type VII secretion protein EccE n=1 Tax=Mycolicibacterium moriokaense TaxID=39691 RepID=A0AAD1HI15_9MYCO|nr:type VII secretion protein EccE [Mycolicibacterium moriokaense]BBX05195.1 hypothetical protein MMOR_61310 [Mycolicibacterium moriokaense]